jgi:hypothetical protein
VTLGAGEPSGLGLLTVLAMSGRLAPMASTRSDAWMSQGEFYGWVRDGWESRARVDGV